MRAEDGGSEKMKTTGKNRKIRLALSIIAAMLILVIGAPFAVFAEDDGYQDSADNYYFSGDSKTVDGGVFFGGFGAGRDIGIQNSQAEDSIALAGYTVTVRDSKIGGSGFLAGYSIDVNNCGFDGNIVAAAKEIDIDSESECNAAILTGMDITFEGEADAVTLSGQKVYINGKIGGDAVITAENVKFGPNAEVTGIVKVEAPEEPVVSPDAELAEVKFIKVEKEDDSDSVYREPVGDRILDRVKSAAYWSAAMVLVGLLMYLLGRNRLAGAREMVKARTGAMLGSGAVALVVTPIAIIICMITFIGLPVGLLTGIAYALIISVSTAFAGASLSPLVFKKMPVLAASLIGIVILEVAKKVPYLGILVSIAAVLYTLGYVIQEIYLKKLKSK